MNSVPHVWGQQCMPANTDCPPAQDKAYISPGGLAGHAQCPAVSPSDLVREQDKRYNSYNRPEQGRPAWRPVCPG